MSIDEDHGHPGSTCGAMCAIRAELVVLEDTRQRVMALEVYRKGDDLAKPSLLARFEAIETRLAALESTEEDLSMVKRVAKAIANHAGDSWGTQARAAIAAMRSTDGDHGGKP